MANLRKMSQGYAAGHLEAQDGVSADPESPLRAHPRGATVVNENAWFPPRSDVEFLMYRMPEWGCWGHPA